MSTLRFFFTGYTLDHLSQIAIIRLVLFLAFFGVCYKKQTMSISAMYLKKNLSLPFSKTFIQHDTAKFEIVPPPIYITRDARRRLEQYYYSVPINTV